MGVPFGFGVGDVIAVADLALAIRKRLSDSGGQFIAIRSDLAGLSLVLLDVAESMKLRELSEEERKHLQSLVQGCQNVFDELSALIENFSILGADSTSFKARSQKAWKKITWDQDEVTELRSRITSNVVMLEAFNGNLARTQIQAGVTEISQHLKGLQLIQQHREILEWLSPLDYSTQQNDSFARRQDGTGAWLLESPEFTTWVGGSNQTLFCPGIPGAGKTIMSSVVIDHLRKTFRKDNFGVAFIYCRYKLRMEQSPLSILSSLLRQLIQGQHLVSKEASTLYEAHKQDNSRPTLQEVGDLLEIEASRYSKVFIVLDALDECSDTDGARRDILSKIRDLQSKGAVNLAATSRWIPTIMHDFKDAVRLEIKASEADVRAYLRGQFHRLPSCVMRSINLQESIEREIVTAVNGMFLLAQLHLDSLMDKVTARAVKAALMDLPKGSHALDVAYDQAMERINNQKPGFRNQADRALSWIIFALRPLTVLELQHALAVELDDPELDEDNLPDPNEMIASCSGLVVVDEESQIIRLVHYTTQEYFERSWEHRSIECHTRIAAICLTYLSFRGVGEMTARMNSMHQISARHTHAKDMVRKFSLLGYSAIHWAKHVRDMSLEPLGTMTLDLLSSPSRVNGATKLLHFATKLVGLSHTYWFDIAPPKPSALHFAAGFGSKELVEALLNTGSTADAKDEAGFSPLHWAVLEGNEAVFRLLLASDDVDINEASDNGDTALHLAVFRRRDTIVGGLLDHPDINVNCASSRSGTPLHLATKYGYEAIVKLLLAFPGIDVNAADGKGSTALHKAAVSARERVVEMLLNRPEIEVNAADRNGSTALHKAAVSGRERVVEMLLNRPDIEVNAADRNGSTALLEAAVFGWERVVAMLLNRPEIEVNAADRNGSTTLHEAAVFDWKIVVEMLLYRSEIEVNAAERHGSIALHKAAVPGRERVVEILLNRPEIEVNAADRMGGRELLRCY